MRTHARRRWLWIAAIIVAVAVIALVVALNLAGRAQPGAQPGAEPSSSASPDAGAPTPTASHTVPPLPTSTPLPEDSPESMPELAPVEPTEPSDNDEGLVAEIVKMTAVQGEAVQAGEIAGPSVQFTLSIKNSTGEPVDLGLIAVNAHIGENRTPATSLIRPGGDPFAGTLADGDSAEGVYVYNIPESERDDVTLTIDYRAGEPAFVFRGEVG